MTTFRPFRAAVGLLMGVVGLCTTAAAQANDEVFTNLKVTGDTSDATRYSVASEVAIYNKLSRKDHTRGTVGGGLVLGRRMQIDVASSAGTSSPRLPCASELNEP